MSWSVSATGKSAVVKEKIEAEIARVCEHLAEPERSIAAAAGTTISASLDGQIPGGVVKVNASGSQSSHTTDGQQVVTNSLKIEIDPIWGFVE